MSTTSLHVEPTTRCTLACPRCERTTFIDIFGKSKFTITDLNVDDFARYIDVDLLSIVFGGNLGDPIYHQDFISLVQIAKQKAKQIKIITNGAYRNNKWWNELVSILDHNDNITFSIDGTPENFTKYRINGDWASVKSAIGICVESAASVTWKYIPFKFNENDIEDTRALSLSMGIDNFEVHSSDRWLLEDEYRPIKFIGERDPVQTSIKRNENKQLYIDPKCATNDQHYISAAGFYSACSYIAHYEFYYKSEWWKEINKYNIKNSKLSDHLLAFNEFYSTIHDTRNPGCIFNCGKE